MLNLYVTTNFAKAIHIQFQGGNGFNIARSAKGGPRLWQIELQLDREIVSKRDQTFMRARTGFKLNILMALDIFDTAIDMKPDTVSPFVCAWLLYNCKIC